MPWLYNDGHSRIGFIVSHFGLTFVHGHFRNAEIKLDVNDEDPTKSTVEVVIDASSLTTDNERRDTNVKGEHYMEVDLYPTITFRSTRIDPKGENQYALIGDFTMHGVTKELALDTRYYGQATDARGTTLRGLAARGTIRKSDFGIQGNPLEPNVAEEIQLVIDVELHDR
jgi:polyisoprenoid-binding protein YceI